MGLLDSIQQGFEQGIANLFDLFNATIGAVVRELLQFVDFMIRNTPYPKCGMSPDCTGNPDAPLLFGEPTNSAIWSSLHGIYVSEVQPYAYILWFLSVIIVTFSGTIEPLFPNGSSPINTEGAKKKLFLAFLGITLWWPLAVLVLAFSDALADLLYGIGIGASGDVSSGEPAGLATVYEIVATRFENQGVLGMGGLAIVTLFWLVEAILLAILSILWVIRYYAIFLYTPLMPLMIAVWALEVPGLGKIKGAFGKIPEYYITAVFLTIPGALMVGFTGQLLNVLAGDIESRENEDGNNIDIDTNPDTGSNSPSLENPSTEGEVIPNPDDPVGTFNPTIDSQTGSSTNTQIQPQVTNPDTGTLAQVDTSNPDTTGTSPGFIATVLFGFLAMGIPILAAGSPFFMVKWGKSAEKLGSLGALAGPKGAVVGKAVSAAGKIDSAVSASDGAKKALGMTGSSGSPSNDEAVGEAGSKHSSGSSSDVSGSNSGFTAIGKGDGLRSRISNAAKSESGLEGSVKNLNSAKGVGFLAAGAGALGVGAAKTAKDKTAQKAGQTRTVGRSIKDGVASQTSNLKQSAAETIRQKGPTAAALTRHTIQNPRVMSEIAKRNARYKADKAIVPHLSSVGNSAKSGLSAIKNAPSRTVSGVIDGTSSTGGKATDKFESLTEAAAKRQAAINAAKEKQVQEMLIAGEHSESGLRKMWEEAPREDKMSAQQKQGLDEHDIADNIDTIKRGAHTETFGQALEDKIEEIDESVTKEEIAEYHGTDVELIDELFDKSQLENIRDEIISERKERAVQNIDENEDMLRKIIAEQRSGMESAQQIAQNSASGMNAITKAFETEGFSIPEEERRIDEQAKDRLKELKDNGRIDFDGGL